MLLALIGFCVAALGTLIGVGGGFLMVPILLILYPDAPNIWVVSLSMWLVALNASSGSVTYYLKGKVHLKSALVFVVAALPGSVLGVWCERFISRDYFELMFGVALASYSIFLFRKKPAKAEDQGFSNTTHLDRDLYVKGALISFGVGFLASLLGIGGGVIHVPLLVHMLGFPVHMATGTSHFILALTALFTTAVHLWHGHLDLADPALWQLGLAAILGAQLGAYFSKKVSGAAILKFLAIALLLVGARLVFMGTRHLGWL